MRLNFRTISTHLILRNLYSKVKTECEQVTGRVMESYAAFELVLCYDSCSSSMSIQNAIPVLCFAWVLFRSATFHEWRKTLNAIKRASMWVSNQHQMIAAQEILFWKEENLILRYSSQFSVWHLDCFDGGSRNQFSLYPLLRASKKISFGLEEEVVYIISKYKNRWDAILVIDGCNQENKKKTLHYNPMATAPMRYKLPP